VAGAEVGVRIALMSEYDGIAGIDGAEFLIGIDLEAVTGEGPYFIILVLKVDTAVVVVKRPDKREGVGLAGAILAKDDDIIPFTTGDAWVECVEDAVIIGAEAGFFIFPGITGEQLHVVSGIAFGRTA
jgi:hypothetical protein